MNTLTIVPGACVQPGECLVLNEPKPGLGWGWSPLASLEGVQPCPIGTGSRPTLDSQLAGPAPLSSGRLLAGTCLGWGTTLPSCPGPDKQEGNTGWGAHFGLSCGEHQVIHICSWIKPCENLCMSPSPSSQKRASCVASGRNLPSLILSFSDLWGWSQRGHIYETWFSVPACLSDRPIL